MDVNSEVLRNISPLVISCDHLSYNAGFTALWMCYHASHFWLLYSCWGTIYKNRSQCTSLPLRYAAQLQNRSPASHSNNQSTHAAITEPCSQPAPRHGHQRIPKLTTANHKPIRNTSPRQDSPCRKCSCRGLAGLISDSAWPPNEHVGIV